MCISSILIAEVGGWCVKDGRRRCPLFTPELKGRRLKSEVRTVRRTCFYRTIFKAAFTMPEPVASLASSG